MREGRDRVFCIMGYILLDRLNFRIGVDYKFRCFKCGFVLYVVGESCIVFIFFLFVDRY